MSRAISERAGPYKAGEVIKDGEVVKGGEVIEGGEVIKGINGKSVYIALQNLCI